MKISFNNFKRQYKKRAEKIDSAVKRVLKSGHFILGKELAKFEDNFADYIGTKHAIGVANGLEALQISLMALDIKEGDEIITTSHSAVATALSIKSVGAKPVFVDIDHFYHIDASKIEEKINTRTKAIIPVHLYGQTVEIDKILELAVKYKINIIEDCAQSHGASYANKKAGSFGALGCFSFYPTKNLGAYGDAGAITTSDDNLAEKCRMIRNYGQKNRYEHDIYGLNSRLDELQAAILSTELTELDNNNKRRKEISKLYEKELLNIKEIKLPKTRDGASHVYHLFVIESERRKELQIFLEKSGVASLIHYPIPIHKQKCFAECNSLKLPATEKKSQRILSLPIHPYLNDKEVLFICKKIKNFYEI